MHLNHSDIAQRLPHAGNMCLLDSVIQYNKLSLTALATSHLAKDNPLRLDNKIAAINGVEYAAQAMAIHASLMTPPLPETNNKPMGYLATVRNIAIISAYLPESTSPINITVTQLMSDVHGFTYEFQLSCDQALVISGKITIFL
jgi:predicted hotdog family 3-hydroxylacyl-ACP dehydratase